MRRALALIAPLLLGAKGPVGHSHTYLLSLVNLPHGKDGAMSAFRIDTWGVTVRAVCKVPYGWRITAGGSANPSGTIAGQGSNGITWFRKANEPALRNLLLVALSGPVQRAPLKDADGEVPATFLGTATVEGADEVSPAGINAENIRLAPAHRCPAQKPAR